MRFTKRLVFQYRALRHAVFRLSFAAGLLVLLSACGTLPEQTADTPPAETPETVDDAPPGLDVSAPDENPYLSQAPTVPNAARAAFENAVAAMQQQQWREAQSILERLIENYPELSGPYLNLGIVYRHLEEPEWAEQAFNKAIEVNRLNLDAYNQLALLKREAGDFEAAEKNYLAALDVWPKHAPSHRNIGILYDLYMGQWQKALRHFEIYQYLQDEPNRQVNGWIIDLNRRIETSNSQAGAQP